MCLTVRWNLLDSGAVWTNVLPDNSVTHVSLRKKLNAGYRVYSSTNDDDDDDDL